MIVKGMRYLLSGELPEHLVCSVTQDLMRNPVKIPDDDRHVFERSAILRSLAERPLNPLTTLEVPAGPLRRQPTLQREAADVLHEAARFERAFGDPRQAAARTIQAAWTRYSANLPDQELAPDIVAEKVAFKRQVAEARDVVREAESVADMAEVRRAEGLVSAQDSIPKVREAKAAAAAAASLADGTSWVTLSLPGGVSYAGEAFDGTPNGFGELSGPGMQLRGKFRGFVPVSFEGYLGDIRVGGVLVEEASHTMLGELRYANGQIYRGFFQGDIRSGLGVLECGEQHMIGSWNDDRLTGPQGIRKGNKVLLGVAEDLTAMRVIALLCDDGSDPVEDFETELTNLGATAQPWP